MKYKIITLLLLGVLAICPSIDVSAQASYQDRLERDSIRQEKQLLIYNLKNEHTTLLVRLRGNSKSLAAYESAGQTEIVKRMKYELRKEHHNLISAFSKFKFCKVLFFHSEDSKKLIAGEHQGIFLNANLEKDPSIVLTTEDFALIDVGPVRKPTEEGKIESPTGISRALVVKDKELKPIGDPFPYYENLAFRSIEKAVPRLENAFNKFYQRSMPRITPDRKRY